MHSLPNIHLAHVLMLLQALECQRRSPVAGASIPPEVFLLREEETSIWELVGLRVRGLDSLLLAGVRFPRQASDDGKLARQSLSSFLSTPTRQLSVAETPRPSHLLEVVLPDPHMPILKFLKRGRQGEAFPTALIDRDDVRLAFDFRLENPSRMRDAKPVASLDRRHLFRTTGGHVLSGLPHGLGRKLHREDPFLALRQPTQHTATGDHALPTLIVHRSCLTMTAQLSGGLTTWLDRTQAFHVAHASAEHLLDPRIENYRAYRDRLLEERMNAQTAQQRSA